jgi:hypothetical protein
VKALSHGIHFLTSRVKDSFVLATRRMSRLSDDESLCSQCVQPIRGEAPGNSEAMLRAPSKGVNLEAVGTLFSIEAIGAFEFVGAALRPCPQSIALLFCRPYATLYSLLIYIQDCLYTLICCGCIVRDVLYNELMCRGLMVDPAAHFQQYSYNISHCLCLEIIRSRKHNKLKLFIIFENPVPAFEVGCEAVNAIQDKSGSRFLLNRLEFLLKFYGIWKH